MQASHPMTLRSHDYSDEELELARNRWATYAYAKTRRSFQRDASIELAASASSVDLHLLSPHDLTHGRLRREEAAFWLSLLSHAEPSREHPDGHAAWVRERMNDVPADDPDAALAALRDHGGLKAACLEASEALGRFAGVLVPWADAFDVACEVLGTYTARLAAFAENLGACPEADRARVLERARAHLEEHSGKRGFHHWDLCRVVPSPEAFLEWAHSIKDGAQIFDSSGHVTLLVANLPFDALEELVGRTRFVIEPHHVRAAFARFGHPGVASLLAGTVARDARSSSPAMVEELGRIRSPEVASALYTMSTHGAWLERPALDLLVGFPSRALAPVLVPMCARADARREWATVRLREVLRQSDGPDAIAQALESAPARLREFVRNNVLDAHERLGGAQLPEWARHVTSLGDHTPEWLPRADLPTLVAAEDGAMLPNASSIGYAVALATSDDSLDGFDPHVTADSLARLAHDLFDQWFQASEHQSKQEELLSTRAAIARHPSVEVLTLVESYLRKTNPPNRRKDPKPQLDEVARLICAVETPDAYALLLRLRKSVKRYRVKEIATAGIREHIEREGITEREFLDIAAPAFELDARGGRSFDYGPRTVRMELAPEGLRFIESSKGKTSARPPKPSTSDEHDLATASHALMSAVSKSLRDEVVAQRLRLERDLISQARWRVPHWREHVLTHPVIGPMARGLVWTLIGSDGEARHVRPTEDGGLIDAAMDEVLFHEHAEVLLTHPLHMSAEELAAWTHHMLEFELSQPFDQVGRATYDASDPEDLALILAFESRSRLVGAKALKKIARQMPITLKLEPHESVWSRTRFELQLDPKVTVAFDKEDANTYALGAILIRPGSTDPEFYEVGNQLMAYADIAPLHFSELTRVLEMASSTT